jgi:hypothetical protein
MLGQAGMVNKLAGILAAVIDWKPCAGWVACCTRCRLVRLMQVAAVVDSVGNGSPQIVTNRPPANHSESANNLCRSCKHERNAANMSLLDAFCRETLDLALGSRALRSNKLRLDQGQGWMQLTERAVPYPVRSHHGRKCSRCRTTRANKRNPVYT